MFLLSMRLLLKGYMIFGECYSSLILIGDLVESKPLTWKICQSYEKLMFMICFTCYILPFICPIYGGMYD